MADNLTTQTASLATIPTSQILAAYEGSFSGQTAFIAPVVLNTVSGSEGSRTFSEISASNPLPISDAAGSITVDATSWPLPTGASTLAEQQTQTTALQLLDNVVRTEDEASAGGHSGVVVLARRTATPANQSGTDGDYEFFQMSAGRVWVSATVDAALPAGDNNIGNVDVVTMPVVSVNDNSGSLTVDNGGTFAVQVDAALPAGGNNIGDVDVLSVVPGTGATSLGKAVDSAAGGTDTGVAPLAVRDDALAALTPVEGDYIPLRVNSTGALWVQIAGGGGAGGTSATDESAYTPTTSAGTPIMGAADETAPDAAAEGTLAIIRSTLNRALHVNLRDAAGAEVAVGGGTQYTEDAAAAADPVGTAPMLVRQDTLSATTVNADGDNIAARAASTGAQYVEVTAGTTKLGDATNGLLVNLGANNDVTASQTGTWNITNVSGTVSLPTGASTLAEQQTQTTALQLLDNVVRTEDEASAGGHSGAVVLARRTDTPANQSGTDGDYEFFQMSAGRIWVSATVDAALPAGDNNIGNVDVVTLPALPAGTNNIGDVDIVSGTITTVTTLTGGGIAHDSADSGNPHKIGAVAKATLEGVTVVATDDRTNLHADLDGTLIIKTAVPLGDLISERVSDTGGTSTAFSTFGAPGAGRRNHITQITVHNAHATTNAYVDIRDGTAGAVLWTIPLPATGGATIHFNPPLRQPTTNTALAYDVSAAVTTIYISVNGFQSGV